MQDPDLHTQHTWETHDYQNSFRRPMKGKGKSKGGSQLRTSGTRVLEFCYPHNLDAVSCPDFFLTVREDMEINYNYKSLIIYGAYNAANLFIPLCIEAKEKFMLNVIKKQTKHRRHAQE